MKNRIHFIIPIIGLAAVMGASIAFPLVSQGKGVNIEIAAVEAQEAAQLLLSDTLAMHVEETTNAALQIDVFTSRNKR